MPSWHAVEHWDNFMSSINVGMSQEMFSITNLIQNFEYKNKMKI